MSSVTYYLWSSSGVNLNYAINVAKKQKNLHTGQGVITELLRCIVTKFFVY